MTHFSKPICAFLLFFLLSPLTVLAQNGDQTAVPPGTILLSAYKAISSAEEFEAKKDYKRAWDKYHQALRYYKSLSSAHPTWNPHIVNGRIESTSEAIDKISPLAQKQHLASRNKVKDFIEAADGALASPNGIPAPKAFTPRERKQLSGINRNLARYQKALETERLRNKAREQTLSNEIGRLQDQLRKSSQGLGKENSQTKILNGEIAKLSQRLRLAKQLDTDTQKKYLDAIERLQRMRAALASAPLRQDVEKLRASNRKYQFELRLLARKQKEKLAEIKSLQSQKIDLQDKVALLKDKFDLNQKQLAASQENSKIVVRALRKENAELQKQLVSAQETIAEQQSQISDLTKRLSESETITGELREELVNMTRERDQLSQLLKLSDVDRGKQLMKENLRLAEELQKSKQSLELLSADKNAAQDRIIEAENDVAIAKKQIIDLKNENLAFKKRVTLLELNLKDTKQELSNKLTTPQLDELARAEARELKKTVQRLITTQNRRQKVIAALGEEYRKMAAKSAGFESTYNILAQENVTLTDRERKLIADRESDATLINSNRSYADSATRNIAEQKVEAKVTAYNSIALRFIEKDQLDVAKDIFDEAYDTTYDFSFLINRGIVRLRIGDQDHIEEAAKILEDGVTTRPKSPYTHFMLGVARFQLEQDDLALKSLDTAIALRPDYPEAYTYRGIIHAGKHQYDKAQENFESAIELNPEFAEAHFNLSELHYFQGNKDEAREAYANALRSGFPINLAHERKLGMKKTS